jgi:TolB-like protein/cytochrome c-type biogenesis protein CcmH/NrfG
MSEPASDTKDAPESRGVRNTAAHQGHPPHIEFRFFEELKKRNVIRVALLYLVTCWLILEPIHVVFHMLEVPLWANRLVLILMAVGFPAVLLFAWVFEITPEGLKPTAEVEAHKSIRPLTGRRLDRAIMAVMALAIVYFVADKFWLSRRPPASTGEQASAPPSPSPAVASVSLDKSIAVLPFIDMSEKKDQEYFSDGLSEEVIDRLTHAADLRVISRTSSFYFKGKPATIGDIARTLGVSHVLEGSVRKAGTQLRITAQLIQASNGSHLWSQTYDRSVTDIFKVQDEIAGTVAQALEVALRSSSSGRTEASQEAYSLLLKGNYFFNRGTDADSAKALDLYTQATRLDPNYALAWAKVGRTTTKDSKGLPKALAALQRSLRIDPNLAYAHYELGRTRLYFESDWAGAKAELERAIELDPDDLNARVQLAYLTEGIFGQFDRKVGYLRQIVANDPLDPYSLEHLASSLFLAGRFEESAASFRRLVQLSPAEEGARAEYGITLLYLHQPREALALIEKEPDEASRLWALAILDWGIGHKTESDAAVSRLEQRYASGNPGYIAEVRAYRGELDAAFKWLDQAYERQKFMMSIMTVDPLLSNLRGDPRFEAMLVKAKLDDWKRKVLANAT